jgi:hypothetical protein
MINQGLLSDQCPILQISRNSCGRWVKEKPLGGMKAWTALHKERTEADDSRG